MERKGFYTDVVVALKDSIILWEFLAKTGRKDKIKAIINLYKFRIIVYRSSRIWASLS